MFPFWWELGLEEQTLAYGVWWLCGLMVHPAEGSICLIFNADCGTCAKLLDDQFVMSGGRFPRCRCLVCKVEQVSAVRRVRAGHRWSGMPWFRGWTVDPSSSSSLLRVSVLHYCCSWVQSVTVLHQQLSNTAPASIDIVQTALQRRRKLDSSKFYLEALASTKKDGTDELEHFSETQACM